MRSPNGQRLHRIYGHVSYRDMDHTHWRPACRMVHLTFERDASTIVDVDRGPYWYELQQGVTTDIPVTFRTLM
jgi:hypothetical protein